MAQSLQQGNTLTYTTAGAVTAGELVVMNQMAGVAMESATGAGKKIAVALDGVFEMAAVATGAKALGSQVGYRTTGGQKKVSAVAAACTGAAYATTGPTLAGGRRAIGTIFEAATAAATSVKVKLIGGPMIPFV